MADFDYKIKKKSFAKQFLLFMTNSPEIAASDRLCTTSSFQKGIDHR